jgi:DNA polymerase (family 10)
MGLADNAAIARVLIEIADLLELRGENLFKIRAYRSAADLVLQWPGRVADLTDAELRQWPGIGKDLSARIPEIAATGTCGLHQDLLRQFPATLPELLRLRGIGAKTVALLHRELGIGSLRHLEDAIRSGRLRTARGIGPRKEQQIAESIEMRRNRRGQHLLSEAHKAAATLVPALQDQVPANEYAVAGSVRRGVEVCGNLDLLAFGEDDSVLRALASYARVEQLLAQDAQAASVLLLGGLQVDLRLIQAAHRGAALIYHTGSRAHREALQVAAAASGFRLDEQGLSRLGDGARVATDSEADVYRTLVWRGCPLNSAKGEESLISPQQAGSRRSSIGPTCEATSTCTPRRATARTPLRPWPSPRAPQVSST